MTDFTNSRRNRPDIYDDSEAMKRVIRPLFFEYLRFRQDKGDRKPNKDDLNAYFRHLSNIVTDLYSAWLDDPAKYIGYSRAKMHFLKGGGYWDTTKDKPLLRQRLFLNLIDHLSERDYIENQIAKKGRNRYSSRMRAKPKLIERLEAENVNWASIKTDTSHSAITVKDKKKKMVPPPQDSSFDLVQAEKNMQRINDNLQSSLLNLNVTDKDYDDLCLRYAGVRGDNEDQESEDHEYESTREPLEFSNRTLRRIFALGSFDNGGRFYGGWWQGVPSEYRKYIEIEGCITVEMDFSTIQPRILYSKAGAKPPEDSYNVPGWDSDLRPVIKKAFNQLINSKDGSRNENQWHRFAPNMVLDPTPKEWATMKKHRRAEFQRNEFERRTGRRYEELLHDLKAMHEPIDKFFFSQAWTWLQRRDSDIAEKVMLKLLDQQYTALPIHDSFIVRRSAERPLLEAMNEAFDEVVGVVGNVDRNETVYDGPQKQPGQGVVWAKDLYHPAQKDLVLRSGYYRRRVEWIARWGLWGYE